VRVAPVGASTTATTGLVSTITALVSTAEKAWVELARHAVKA
jgi:hypothetical protein